MDSRDNGINSPQVTGTALKTASIQVERKRFNLMLKENERGKYLRITEAGPRKNCIIIPASGVGELAKVLGEMEVAK